MAAPANAEGDAEAGELLAFTCMGCHGIDGYRNAYPSYRVPRLGGQRAEYIVDALTAYKNGTRPHPTMQAQGGPLSEQDIEDLAAWFQGETPAADTVTDSDVATWKRPKPASPVTAWVAKRSFRSRPSCPGSSRTTWCMH